MQIREVILRDTRVNQPVASDANDGFLYFVTDESVLERSNGTSWETVSPITAPDWGDIGGTLSDQTDLQSELDGKEDTIGYTPENTANKATTMAGNTGSNTLFLTAKAIYDWAVATFQSALGFTPEDSANKDTDGTLSANSDAKYASQKATKTYADTKLPSSYLDTDGTLSANSDAKIASQKATKTYADGKVSDTAYDSAFNGVTDVAPSKNAIYDRFDRELDGPVLSILKELGSSILALPMGIGVPGSSLSMADGTAYYTAVWIPRACTITGVKFWQSVQGSYTADNNNKVGLYSYSGGTLTKVAESASDGNLWKQTSNTFGTKAFSSPYSASKGLYFVAMLYNSSAQSTAPNVPQGYSVNTGLAAAFDLTNSAKILAIRTSQTDLPASESMSNLSGNFNTPNFQLY